MSDRLDNLGAAVPILTPQMNVGDVVLQLRPLQGSQLSGEPP
jgi:hypothetical protein